MSQAQYSELVVGGRSRSSVGKSVCLLANRHFDSGSRPALVGFDARFFGKSFETVLNGVFFRSTVVSDKFISRRVDLQVVAYQFPRPSVGRRYVIFVVPTAKL